jgi:hypothetical protein
MILYCLFLFGKYLSKQYKAIRFYSIFARPQLSLQSFFFNRTAKINIADITDEDYTIRQLDQVTKDTRLSVYSTKVERFEQLVQTLEHEGLYDFL